MPAVRLLVGMVSLRVNQQKVQSVVTNCPPRWIKGAQRLVKAVYIPR